MYVCGGVCCCFVVAAGISYLKSIPSCCVCCCLSIFCNWLSQPSAHTHKQYFPFISFLLNQSSNEYAWEEESAFFVQENTLVSDWGLCLLPPLLCRWKPIGKPCQQRMAERSKSIIAICLRERIRSIPCRGIQLHCHD